MKWEPDAEKAIQKVPFFVRKRVRKKVEAHAGQEGSPAVTLAHVKELQKKVLSKEGMEVPGIHSRREVLDILKKAVKFYKTHSTERRRFSQLLDSVDQIEG